MTISSILPVVAATFAAFMMGGLWYGPLFGKRWQIELGWNRDEWASANKPQLFAISFVCEAIIALALSHVLGRIPHTPAITLMITLGSAVGFVLPTLIMNYRYALKSWTLIAIDAGHWLLVFLVIGAVYIVFGV